MCLPAGSDSPALPPFTLQSTDDTGPKPDALTRGLDAVTGVLICASLVFAPWAFATTPPWSIRILNTAGLALAVLLVLRLALRWCLDQRAPRLPSRHPPVTRLAAVLTLLVLAWCLVSALNARSTVLPDGTLQEASRFIPWLPHSHDAPRTWAAFWQTFTLAALFWSLQVWLSATPPVGSQRPAALDEEVGTLRRRSRPRRRRRDVEMPALPPRLRLLLWVLGVNGLLLTLQGIAQRLTGSAELLWLWKPAPDAAVTTGFGPFVYRGNAAQYLNLLWPLCLAAALWVHAKRTQSQRGGWTGLAPLFLAATAVLMAGTVLVLGTRAGAVVCLGLLALSGLYAVVLLVRWHGAAALLVLLIPAGIVAVGAWLGLRTTFDRLLRPAYAWPTGLEQPLPSYSLRCVFEVPSTNQPLPWATGLVAAGPSDSFAYVPGSTWIAFWSGGGLFADFPDPAVPDGLRLLVPQFLQQYSGQTVDLVLTRGAGVHLYVNGQPVADQAAMEAVPDASVPAAEKTGRLSRLLSQSRPADYLWAGSLAHVRPTGPQWVQRAELYDRALTPRQVAHLAQGRVPLAPGEVSPEAESIPEPVRSVTAADLRRPGFLNPYSSGRVDIDRTSRRMLQAYGWLGSGPGTYGTLYPRHASRPPDFSPVAAHNDWLELRITWGLPGIILLLALLVCVPLGLLEAGGRWWAEPLPVLALLALAGCLAHARVDYPLQLPAVAQLTLIIAALAWSPGRQAVTTPSAPLSP